MGKFEPELLHRRWVHAHEEDTDDRMVFRPAERELPPSRGRQAFELRPDGTFWEAGLGAADVPEEATGDWRLEEGSRIVLGEGASSGLPRSMRIAAVEPDRLVIEK
jgi:hypothetical protein